MSLKSLCVLVVGFVFTLSAGAVGFQLPWVNAPVGKTIYNSDETRSGVFVVEAYFNTCPACNRNAQNVNDLAGKYANEPRVQVVDVGIDTSPQDYQSWIQKHQPNHPVLKDEQRTLIRRLNVRVYPTTLILDCSGNVAFRSIGVWSTETKRRIDETIARLLMLDCDSTPPKP